MKSRNNVKSNRIQPNSPPKLISFVGRSNSGKTTLLTKLIPKFIQLGLKVGTIKNTHHKVEFDKPGKDSWKYAQSGSQRVLVSSGKKLAVFIEQEEEVPLKKLAEDWFFGMDLVISEGFKNEDCFKIEVIRSENNKSPLFVESSYAINAIISDIPQNTNLPYFNFNELDKLVSWICKQLKLVL